ncbi:MAG: hypothetical protein LUE86_13275 [Clostridiales bacterium]|nr:hypothetical protein [Clostridiales bacterium]
MYNIKDLRTRYHVSRKLLTKITLIPYRTIQNWELGRRECKPYEYRMIEYQLIERADLLKYIFEHHTPYSEKYDVYGEWFQDTDGYGVQFVYKEKCIKKYIIERVCFRSIPIIEIFSDFRLEELLDIAKWEESYEKLYSDA